MLVSEAAATSQKHRRYQASSVVNQMALITSAITKLLASSSQSRSSEVAMLRPEAVTPVQLPTIGKLF